MDGDVAECFVNLELLTSRDSIIGQLDQHIVPMAHASLEVLQQGSRGLQLMPSGEASASTTTEVAP